MSKRFPTFVCRRSENTELMKCICGLCRAEHQLDVAIGALKQITSWCTRSEPTGHCYIAECHAARQALAEIERIAEESGG